MACILFFALPAYGHVNPTLPLVRELTARGHRVLYVNGDALRAPIEAAGAALFSMDPYMPPPPADIERRAGRDFAALMEMATDATLALDGPLRDLIAQEAPACAVVDSVCVWGKLLARKYGLPSVCSTPTLAFNAETAKALKRGPGEALRMVLGLPRMGRCMARLERGGYGKTNVISLIGHDETLPAVVYTSRRFQPQGDTFPASTAFVGPLVMQRFPRVPHARPQVYIALGTVLNRAPRFYRRCIAALRGMDADALLVIGPSVDPAALGPLPENVRVAPRVNQLEALASADVFLTHCGMNSVSESLLCGVPMVLWPQHSEESAIAARVQALHAGVPLTRTSPRAIRAALERVLADGAYRAAAQAMAEDFAHCGGASEAADVIEMQLCRGQTS